MEEPKKKSDFLERFLIERRASINKKIERTKHYARTEGHAVITPETSAFNELDHFEVIAQVQKSGEFIVVKRGIEDIWDVMINPGFDINRSIVATNSSVRRTNLFQIGSLIATGLAIIIGAVFQVMTYNITKLEFKLHMQQDSSRISDQVPERSRQESIKGTLEMIQRNLDTIGAKMTRAR